MSNPRDKTVAAILAKTGCRLTEALEIKMDDLMLDTGYIRLRQRKSGKQTVVPIDEEAVQAIERCKLVRGDPSEGHLFVSIQGSRVSRERLRRTIRESAVDTGVMERGKLGLSESSHPIHSVLCLPH